MVVVIAIVGLVVGMAGGYLSNPAFIYLILGLSLI